MLDGMITALVTPMQEDGSIDFTSLERLVNYQIKNKVDGLVVIGSTGEGTTLTKAEKLAVIAKVVEINNKRVPIIVGVSQVSTAEALEWISELNAITGIDYLLVVTPAYVKAPQHGLYQHFASVAKLSNYPIIMYNVPGRTCCDLHNDTVLKLASEFKNIVGLKDATGDLSRCGYLFKHMPPGFMVYSGDDITAMAFTLCGGSGVISVVGNAVPKIMGDMIRAALASDRTQAITFNNQILELHSLFFVESNPIPLKWALYKLGVIAKPILRLPLETLSEIYHANIDKALNNINMGDQLVGF